MPTADIDEAIDWDNFDLDKDLCDLLFGEGDNRMGTEFEPADDNILMPACEFTEIDCALEI